MRCLDAGHANISTGRVAMSLVLSGFDPRANEKKGLINFLDQH